jgi:hypothetical protein
MKDKLVLKDSSLKPTTISFHNSDGKEVGKFIIEGETLKFEGNAHESSTIFIELVLQKFINGIKSK